MGEEEGRTGSAWNRDCRGEVAQAMNVHVSKWKNDKRRKDKTNRYAIKMKK
jgi:hypothetical protein